jgi:phosphotransferase system  glucose/maltose/N-acetylglucosamine-specific IIC component
MNQQQMIVALLSGAIVALLGWQLGKTLLSGEVTISLNGRGARRDQHPRVYWSWTLVLAGLWLVVLFMLIRAVLHH